MGNILKTGAVKTGAVKTGAVKTGITAAALLAALVAALAGPALADDMRTPSPAGAAVYFANLTDGATVGAPVTIVFGLRGMGVAPAGVDKKGTGHHHIFLDRPAFGKGMDGADELAANIPADENHLHFGGGQTETTLNLKPGRHSLQLVLGDKDHIPHDPPVVSRRITITVK